jgi:hypothetical protein
MLRKTRYGSAHTFNTRRLDVLRGLALFMIFVDHERASEPINRVKDQSPGEGRISTAAPCLAP